MLKGSCSALEASTPLYAWGYVMRQLLDGLGEATSSGRAGHLASQLATMPASAKIGGALVASLPAKGGKRGAPSLRDASAMGATMTNLHDWRAQSVRAATAEAVSRRLPSVRAPRECA